MREIIPVKITADNFAAYGRCYDLRSPEAGKALGRQEFISRERVSAEPLKVGVTAVKGGTFLSKSMERHLLGEEVLMCGDDDMVLTVADSDPWSAPQSGDVKAFAVSPGHVVVLKKGIWHDANHGVHKDTSYFFLIPQREFVASEVAWTEISPEPVKVVWDVTADPDTSGAEIFSSIPTAGIREFELYGSYVKVIDGEGMPGDTGWRSWLEVNTGLEDGAYFGIHYADGPWAAKPSMDGAAYGSSAVSCLTDEMERDEETERQIICPHGELIIAVTEEMGRQIKLFRLNTGDYVVLKKGICFQVSGCCPKGGYYYTMALHDHGTVKIHAEADPV